MEVSRKTRTAYSSDGTRRRFLSGALAAAVAALVTPDGARADTEAARASFEDIRKRTLQYIERMRVGDGPYGRYRYATGMAGPTLYSSTYAAMARGLYRDLESVTAVQRREWIDYLQSHQDDDGLFRDPAILGEGWYRGDPEWCGRRHLSCHVVTALTCLGAVATRPMRFLEPFYQQKHLLAWLESRGWRDKVDYVGNEVLNLGTLLQYARDFQKEPRAAAAVETLLDWLSRHQVQPETGLWGQAEIKDPRGLSRAVQAAYHLWLLFFYDRKPIPHGERVVDQVLRTENPKGGFGWGVHGPQSSACEDIDSIDPLVRLLFLTKYRREDIRKALERAVTQVLKNQNADGGFVFVRDMKFSYGHPLMTSERNASGMFPTWFRTLSLAYLGKALPESILGGFPWQFQNCPGIQFWTPA